MTLAELRKKSQLSGAKSPTVIKPVTPAKPYVRPTPTQNKITLAEIRAKVSGQNKLAETPFYKRESLGSLDAAIGRNAQKAARDAVVKKLTPIPISKKPLMSTVNRDPERGKIEAGIYVNEAKKELDTLEKNRQKNVLPGTSYDYEAGRNKETELDVRIEAARVKLEARRKEQYESQQKTKLESMSNVKVKPDYETAKSKVNFTGWSFIPSGSDKADKTRVRMALDDNYRSQTSKMSMLNNQGHDVTANLNELTPEEKDVLAYYAGKGEWTTAGDYLKTLERTLNKRMRETDATREQSFISKHPVIGLPVAIARNVAGNLAAPAAAGANALQVLKSNITGTYEPSDPNSRAYAGANLASDTAAGIHNEIYNTVKAKTGSETWAGLAGFVADTSLSVVQNLARIPLGATGMLLSMGASAAGQQTTGVLQRGGTNEQAMVSGMASGAVEILTEKLPLDNLFKIIETVGRGAAKASVKEVIELLIKQPLSEAAEEGIAELSGNVIDQLVMGDKSEYNQYIELLKFFGVSDEDARRKANLQFYVKNIGAAMAGGALSGLIMGGSGAVIGKIQSIALPYVSPVKAETRATVNSQAYYAKTMAGVNQAEVTLKGKLIKSDKETEIYNRLATAKSDIERSGIVNGARQEDIDFAKQVKERSGIDIIFFSEDVTEEGNIHDGFEYGGVLYVNTKSEQAVEWVTAHELTHSIESTGQYSMLFRHVIGRMSKNALVEERMKIASVRAEDMEDMTKDQIDREIVADFAAKHLFKSKEAIIDLVRADRTLGEKIHDWIVGVVARIKGTGTDAEKFLDTAEGLYREALAQARKAEKKADVERINASTTKSTATRETLWTINPKNPKHPSAIQRDKNNVGKKVGSQVYVHKNYESDVVPEDVLSEAKDILGDFQYNAIMYNTKKPNIVRFDSAPGFDTEREPAPGEFHEVDIDTGKVRVSSSQNIWHHKWMWVKDDYKGFDVNESYNWSKEWLGSISNPSGSYRVWKDALDSNNLPHDKVREATEKSTEEAQTKAEIERDIKSRDLGTKEEFDKLVPWEDAQQDVTSAGTSINKDRLPQLLGTPAFQSEVLSLVQKQGSVVIADLGGGKYDNAKQYFESSEFLEGKPYNPAEYAKANGKLYTKDPENKVQFLVYDRWNRTDEYNKETINAIRDGKADIVVINNVTNVIGPSVPELDANRVGEGNTLPSVKYATKNKDGVETFGESVISSTARVARGQLYLNAANAIKPDGTVYITPYVPPKADEVIRPIPGRDTVQLYRKPEAYLTETKRFFGSVTVKGDTITAKKPVRSSSEIRYSTSAANKKIDTEAMKRVEERDREFEQNVSEETLAQMDEYGLSTINGTIVSREIAEQNIGVFIPPTAGEARFATNTYNAFKAAQLAKSDDKELALNQMRNAELCYNRIVASDAIMAVMPQGNIEHDKMGPLRTNIEYVWTFDVIKQCARTLQFQKYKAKIEKYAGRPMTAMEARNLIEMMRACGQQIICVYCYVEGKRINLSDEYNNYFEKRRAVLSADTDEEAIKSMYGLDEKTGELTKASAEVFAEWRKTRDYNPTIEEVYTGADGSRKAIFNYLDEKYGGKENYTRDEASKTTEYNLPVKLTEIEDDVMEKYNVINKDEKNAVLAIVETWNYDKHAGIPHPADTDSEPVYNAKAVVVNHQAYAYAKSSTKASKADQYQPYTDQVWNIEVDRKIYINGMGGIRKHSSNDFRIDMLLDYVMFFTSLAADRRGGVGWFGHTYSKDPDYAEIFAMTNDMINMSIAMDGDYITGITPNVREGAYWDRVQELRKKYKNVGSMAMVTNNDQLSWALKTDWVDMIIPFHASGMPKYMWYNLMGWFDFSGVQSEKFYSREDKEKRLSEEKGIKASKKMTADQVTTLYNENFTTEPTMYVKEAGKIKVKTPHFFPGQTTIHGINPDTGELVDHILPGHGNNVETYFKLCKEYGVKPRFAGLMVLDKDNEMIDVVNHPGYLKLIKETARTDPDYKQKELVAEFNLDYAFKKLEEFAGIIPGTDELRKSKGYENLEEDPFGIVDNFIKTQLGQSRRIELTDLMKKIKNFISETEMKELQSAAGEEDLAKTKTGITGIPAYVLSDTDSEGKGLRAAQVKFFNDSDALDSNGALEVLYVPVASIDEMDTNGEIGYRLETPGKYKDGPTTKLYANITRPFISERDYGTWDGKTMAAGFLNDEIFAGSTDDADLSEIIAMDVESGNEAMRNFLRNKGYDGVRYLNRTKRGETARYTYFVLDTNQVRETSNLVPNPKPPKPPKPPKKPRVKKAKSVVPAGASLSTTRATDSDGKELSEAQIETFKDSKVKTFDGELMPMYHATKADFTVFDKEKIGSGGAGRYLGYGFNYASSEGTASQYGNKVMSLYLNIKNPITDTEKTMTPREVSRLIQDIDSANPDFADDVTMSIAWDFTGSGPTVRPGDSAAVRNIKYKRGTEEAARQIVSYAESNADIYSSLSVGSAPASAVLDAITKTGKDGVIWHNENGDIQYAVTFEPNQAKDISNLNPTGDPDIRRSTSRTEKKLETENKKLQDLITQLKEQVEITTEIKPNEKSVRSYVVELVKGYNSSAPADQIAKRVTDFYKQVTNNKTGVVDFNNQYNTARGIAEFVITEKDSQLKGDLLTEAIEYTAYEIIDRVYDFPRKAPTFADRAAEVIKQTEERLEKEKLRNSKREATLKAQIEEQKHLTKQAEVQAAWDAGADDYFAEETLAKEKLRNEQRISEINKQNDERIAKEKFKNGEKVSGLKDQIEEQKHLTRQAEVQADWDSGAEARAYAVTAYVKQVRRDYGSITPIRTVLAKIRNVLDYSQTGSEDGLRKLATEAAREILAGAGTQITSNEERFDAGTEDEDQTYQNDTVGFNLEADTQKIADEIVDRFYTSSRMSKQQVVKVIDLMAKADSLYARIEETRRYFRNRIKESRVGRDMTHMRAAIKKLAKKMVKAVRKPDNKNYVSDEIRPTVLKLFEMIAGSPVLADAEGDPKADTLRELLSKVSLWYRRTKKNTVGTFTFDPDMQQMFDDAESDLSVKAIIELNYDELTNLSELVRAIAMAIKNENKAFKAGRDETIGNLADAVLRENDLDNKHVSTAELAQTLDRFITSMSDPDPFFEQLGPTMHKLFRNIAFEGQDLNIRISEEIVEFMKNTFAGIDRTYWDGDKSDYISIDLSEGRAEFTPDMLMSVYLLTQREQAVGHILGHGIAFKPPGVDEPNETMTLTQEDLDKILSEVTPQMRKVADAMGGFVTNNMSALGNETSRSAYGYSKFLEKKYWKIYVWNGELTTEFGNNNLDPTLAGNGSTKSTQLGAKNTIIIESAVDTFDKHVRWMAAYRAYVLPLMDMERVLNHRNEGGKTVMGMLMKKHGPAIKKYIDEFFRLVNTGNLSNNLWNDEFSLKLLRGFKGAAVGWNISVILKQYVSIIRAADMINPKYIGEAMKILYTPKRRKEAFAEMIRRNPIAVIKEWGYTGEGFGKSLRQLYDKSAMDFSDKMAELTGVAPSYMDKLAWLKIWEAVKIEQEAQGVTDPREVENRFKEVIFRTQVVNTVFSTPNLMNQTTIGTKYITAFMAEPMKTLNMLAYAIMGGNTGTIVRTSAVVLANTFVISLISTALRHLRAKDDEEDTLASISAEVGLDMLTSIVGMAPYVRDVLSIFQGYDILRTDMTGVAKIVNAVRGIVDDVVRVSNGDEPSGTVLYHLKNVISSLADTIGIPATTVLRDFEAITSKFARATGNVDAEFLISAAMYNPAYDSNRHIYYDMLSRYASDDRDYNKLKNKLIKAYGYDPSAIETGVRNRFKTTEEYLKVYNPLEKQTTADVKNKWFLKLPAAEQKEVLDNVNTYASAVAMKKVDDTYKLSPWAENVSKAVSTGLTAGEYILFMAAKKKADADGNGAYTNVEKINALRDIAWMGDRKRKLLFRSMTLNEEGESNAADGMDALIKTGITFNKFLDIYQKFSELSGDKTLKASQRALKFATWLDTRYTQKQSDTAQEYLGYWSGAKANPVNYEKFTQAGIDYDVAYEIADAITKLVPEAGKTTVSDAQKLDAIVKSGVSDDEIDQAFSVIMSISGYKSYTMASKKGVTPAKFLEYYTNAGKISSDKKDGEPIDGSAKQKTLTMIDRMALTDSQKDALYYAQGYSAKTISDAPWRGGKAYPANIYGVYVDGIQLRK